MFLGTVLAFIYILTILAGCGGQTKLGSAANGAKSTEGQQHVMRIGYLTTEPHPEHVEMIEFKKRIEEKAGSRLKVELYGLSKLGNPNQMLQGLQAGSIQGVIMPASFYGGMIPAVTIVDLPELFPDVNVASKVMNSRAASRLEDMMIAKGIVPLAWFQNSPNKEILSKSPIRSSADLKGKKIRTLSAPVLQWQINELGGAAVPLDPGEVYTALQQGTIDGVLSDSHFVYTMKLYEVAKYRIEAPKGGLLSVFVASKKWLDSLPEDLRQLVVTTARDVVPFGAEYSKSLVTKELETFEAAGVRTVEVSPAFEEELKVMSKKVTDRFLQTYPETKIIYEDLSRAASQ